MPATGTPARARRDEQHGGVRFAFQLPRTMLRAVKRAALDRDMTATDLVHEWVTVGLAGGYDDQRITLPPRELPMSQFPVTLTRPEREALQVRCVEEGMSGAQLVRRWVAHGLQRAG